MACGLVAYWRSHSGELSDGETNFTKSQNAEVGLLRVHW
jgi:hypothetical protein